MRVNKNTIYYFAKGLNLISLTIPLLTFIFVCILSYKALMNKSVIDNYEEYFLTIEYKEKETIDFSYNNDLIAEEYKNIEINDYINCLKKNITEEEINEKIKLTVKTLKNLFDQSYNHFAFKYTDIYTGFTISYNENQEIFTASTIKAPSAIYIYEMAELGLIDLEEKLTYTPSYYNTGSGILKNKKFNEQYTIRDLVSYSITVSDNAAHNMLMDRFGRANMYNFWKDKNAKSIFKQYSNWGVTNAVDATIYMKELYDYYNTNTELSNELMNNFVNVKFKPLSSRNGDKVTANKSGWTGSVFHDAAIVFDDNPYILVVLSNTGLSGYNYLFNQSSKLVGQLHEEYWNLKVDMCQSIIK